MTNTLSFNVEKRYPGGPALIPCIDGVPLPTLVQDFEAARGFHRAKLGYGGIIPAWFNYGPLHEYFLGRAKDTFWNDRVYLLGCICGEVGCWPLEAVIHEQGAHIVWSRFAQPHRPRQDYSGFGPFVLVGKRVLDELLDLFALHAHGQFLGGSSSPLI
jgi:hypothetical protein